MTGCSSVMLARAAEWNCSIFRKEGLLPMDTVIKEYLKLAVDYDNSPSNTKYCVQNILRELQDTPRGRQFLDCQTLEQIWYNIFFCHFKNNLSFYAIQMLYLISFLQCHLGFRRLLSGKTIKVSKDGYTGTMAGVSS